VIRDRGDPANKPAATEAIKMKGAKKKKKGRRMKMRGASSVHGDRPG